MSVLPTALRTLDKLTRKRLQALAGDDVPHLDGGVRIAGHQNVLPQLHARGQTLVTHKGVLAAARLRVPHANRCVQRTRHDVDSVKLKTNVTR